MNGSKRDYCWGDSDVVWSLRVKGKNRRMPEGSWREVRSNGGEKRSSDGQNKQNSVW